MLNRARFLLLAEYMMPLAKLLNKHIG